MVLDLRPYHRARLRTVLFALPALWPFCVEGVTTHRIRPRDGKTSSSSDFGSQLGGSFVWIVLAAGPRRRHPSRWWPRLHVGTICPQR